jgi:TonB family protein
MKYFIITAVVAVLGLLLIGAESFRINDPYGSYAQSVHKIINQSWGYKENSAHRKAVVHFYIGRDGKIIGIPTVSEPSGDSYYDALAIKAVYESAPFPPLPATFNEDKFEVFFEFTPKT